MVLLERWRHDKALSEAELVDALDVLESTVAGGSLYVVTSPEQVETACALVERTYQLMFE